MAPRPRWLAGQPGRLAAVGGAAVVTVLSVSGALGLSPTSHRTTTPGGPVQGQTAIGAAHGAADSAGATGESPVGAQPRAPAATASSAGAGAGAAVALPGDSGSGRRVVFDVSAQRVWLVGGDGAVRRTYPVSGSKYHNLDLGTYHVYSRSRTATAYNSNETMQYMVRFASGRTSAIGFHSIPALPSGKLVEARSKLGTPQSDGCIRQWLPDAKAMWRFARVGTTVVVDA